MAKRSSGGTDDPLRDFLRRKVQDANDDAIRTGGYVSPENLEALSRLARLVEIRQAVQPPPPRQWGLVFAAMGGTLLLVSILFFARVGEAEVELELELSEVSFLLPTPQVLTDTMQLSALGISPLPEMEIPRAEGREAQTLKPFSGARFSSDFNGSRQGSISLASSLLPADTQVWVRRTNLPRQYRLSLKGTGTALRADVDGPVRVGFSGGGSEQLDFVTPQAVVLNAGAEEIDLDLAFPDLATTTFSPQLAIDDLLFLHIDEVLETNRSLVRRLSTVLSGTIYFVSLNDQAYRLRPGEAIQCESSTGELRTLRLQDDHIEVKFHGRVRGLASGLDGNRRTLMPTWLEWLRARHGLSLLWGTALYLFGLIAGVLRWLGKRM